MAKQETGTAVATTAPALPKVLAAVQERAAHLESLNRAIPSDKVLATLKMAVNRDRSILNCTEASVVDAVSKACADGLMLDGREAAIQARNAKTGKKLANGKDEYVPVAVYVPMFQGLMKRARNSGEIASFQATAIVYANEVAIDESGKPSFPSPITGGLRFVFQQGDNESIFHDPILFTERGEPVGCYSIVKLRDGTVSREFMTWRQIMGIKGRNARTGKDNQGNEYTTGINPVWNSDPEEMAKKTVIRRHCKKLPLSSDLAGIFANLDAADPINPEPQSAEEAETREGPTKARGGAARALAQAQGRQETPHDPETGEIVDAEIVDEAEPGPDSSQGDGPGEEGGDYF